MKKKLLCLFAIMLIIASGFAVVIWSGSDGRSIERAEAGEKFDIVTSFYPIYIAVLNITEGMSDVQVENLTENQTGCLHDYQLTTQDMKKLEKADALVLNGGGMEGFVQKAAASCPDLPMVYSDTGISMTEAKTDHSHGGDLGTEVGERNAHIWMDMERYTRQIQNIAQGLAALDPQRAENYIQNAEEYIAKVEELERDYRDTFGELPRLEVILFHDAFAYLQEEVPLDIAHAVEIEGDSALSAGEIAEIIGEIRLHGIEILLTEEQYRSTIADSIAEETGARVYVLDSLVSGSMEPDAYLKGMEENRKVLEAIWKSMY